MKRISLAITILLSIVIPFNLFILGPFTTVRQLRVAITPVGAAVVIFVCKYFVVALLLYGLLRVTKLSERFYVGGPGSTMVLVANWVALVFVFLVSLLATIEGGGPAFILSQFTPYIMIPAYIAMVWGLVRLWRPT